MSRDDRHGPGPEHYIPGRYYRGPSKRRRFTSWAILLGLFALLGILLAWRG
jgi:hypothetical protein